MIEVLDPGYSQFRGLTLFDLFVARYLLARGQFDGSEKSASSHKSGKTDKLADNFLHLAVKEDSVGSLEDEGVWKELEQTLEECVRCLSIEIASSHCGGICKKAENYLEVLRAQRNQVGNGTN